MDLDDDGEHVGDSDRECGECGTRLQLAQKGFTHILPAPQQRNQDLTEEIDQGPNDKGNSVGG
jgi:hypothetical protein